MDDLRASMSGSPSIMSYKDNQKPVAKLRRTMQNVYYALIGITMFLCFYTLSVRISTRLYNERRDVAILRSVGMTKYRIKTLYLYEAVTQVLTSCILGAGVGSLIGFVLLKQFNLFLGSDVTMFFPYWEFLLFLALSLVCSIIAAYVPSTYFAKRTIAEIFRMF